jgi:hypothetical protein
MEATMSNRDRNFILNPNEWPMLILPLKRSGFECAVFAPPISKGSIPEDAPLEILIGTMFDKLSELPRKKYENVDALLADGWRVD